MEKAWPIAIILSIRRRRIPHAPNKIFKTFCFVFFFFSPALYASSGLFLAC